MPLPHRRARSSTCSPTASFPISQPALSQHLRVLREAGLVGERRSGRLRIYRHEAEPLTGLRGWLERYERLWDARLDRLGHVLDDAADEEAA